MLAGFINNPEPMMLPITIAVAGQKFICRNAFEEDENGIINKEDRCIVKKKKVPPLTAGT
jgi:hypothetical protein